MKKYFSLVLLAGISLLYSCNFLTRDNYDPYISDEEACRELVKVEKCLQLFEKSEWIGEYTMMELKSHFANFSDNELKTAIFLWGQYGERANGYENHYLYSKEHMTFSKQEAKEVYEVYETLDNRNQNVMNDAENILYRLCDSEVILKEEGNYPETDNLFYKHLEEELVSIFNKTNTPRIDWSELVNDDNQQYQIWEISKESDKELGSGTKITVFFNEKNERSLMRLFHTKN